MFHILNFVYTPSKLYNEHVQQNQQCLIEFLGKQYCLYRKKYEH